MASDRVLRSSKRHHDAIQDETKLSRLESLPDELLSRLFDHLVDKLVLYRHPYRGLSGQLLPLLFISKRLLPFVRRQLYERVHVHRKNIDNFMATLAANEMMLRGTRTFHLEMGDKGYSPSTYDAVEIHWHSIAACIQMVPEVTDLIVELPSIGDCEDRFDCAYLLESLGTLRHLRHLSWSNTGEGYWDEFEDRRPPDLCLAGILDALHHEVQLSTFAYEGAAARPKKLGIGSQRLTTVRRMNLGNDALTGNGPDLICPELQELHLTRFLFHYAHLGLVSEDFWSNSVSKLRVLSLENMNGHMIGKILAQRPPLERLSTYKMHGSCELTEEIVRMLPPTLKELRLAESRFHLEAMTAQLCQLPALKEISLQDCFYLGLEGIPHQRQVAMDRVFRAEAERLGIALEAWE